MEPNVAIDAIRVGVSSDKLAADLVIPPGFPAQMLTEDLCLNLVRQAGIHIDDPVVRAIRSACEGYDSDAAASDVRITVACGQPAQHGQDGTVEWADFDPGQSETETEEDTSYSHYDRKSYCTVAVGDILGRVIPPTGGEDGQNVLGGVITAKPGRSYDLKFDESLIKDASGNLIAQCNGVLICKGSLARVCQKLELPEYVDFSTGNVDFPGDVLVQRGVRDQFEVRASGTIEVRGLIEAASIISGADLIAHSGMAGREQGTINVGGILTTKYLENVTGQVLGDVSVDREMVNCDIQVRGAVDVSRGRIVGGVVLVAGAVSVGAIGSAANVPTRLVLGTIPELEAYVTQLTELVDKLTEKRDKLQFELEQINKNTRVLTAQHRERQTEIMFEVDMLDDKIDRGTVARQTIDDRIAQRKVVELTVNKQLHQGSILSIAGRVYRIERDIKGPLVVKLRGRAEVVCSQRGGDFVPLAQIIKA